MRRPRKFRPFNNSKQRQVASEVSVLVGSALRLLASVSFTLRSLVALRPLLVLVYRQADTLQAGKTVSRQISSNVVPRPVTLTKKSISIAAHIVTVDVEVAV